MATALDKITMPFLSIFLGGVAATFSLPLGVHASSYVVQRVHTNQHMVQKATHESAPLICSSEGAAKSPSENKDGSDAGTPLLTHLISKSISKESLAKLASTSVTVNEHGQSVKYSGPPLRMLLKQEVSQIDEMRQWKNLAKQKVMLEVLGKDGFPALFSAVEVATNQSGDRFILAVEADGKPMESVKLICPNDEQHTRWVRDCELLKIFAVEQ